MNRLTVPCDACEGKGTVPRPAGKTIDGLDDERAVASLWPALCDKCSGSGRMTAPGPGENG